MRGWLLVLLFGVSPAFAAPNAQELLDQGRFEEALKSFQAGGKSDAQSALGAGLALYRLERFTEAKAKFQESAEKASSSAAKGKALYNLGNSLTQLEQYKEAVAVYEVAQKLIPGDQELEENLEYVKKLIKEQNQSGGGGGGKSDQKSDGKGAQNDQGGQGDAKQSGEGGNDQKQQPQGGPDQKGDGKGGPDKKDKPNDPQKGDEKSDQKQQPDKGDQQQPNQGGGKGDEQGGGGKGDEQQQSSQNPGEEEQKAGNDRAETLLNAVDSDRGQLMKYRERKAVEELKRRNEEIPLKDW